MDPCVFISPFLSQTQLYISGQNVKNAANELFKNYLQSSEYYVESNGVIISDEETVVEGQCYYIRLRVRGGKGGFGSMLRSIGAQIEKTTNREACRDLSGRRMRDINNEKQLQEWAAKAAEREKAKAERRRERRERLKAGPARHTFHDPQYEQIKASIADNIDDAIEQGLQKAEPSCSGLGAAASASSSSDINARKRKCSATETVNKKAARRWLAVDPDVTLSSSDDSSDEVAVDDHAPSTSSATAMNGDAGPAASGTLDTDHSSSTASEDSDTTASDDTSNTQSSTLSETSSKSQQQPTTAVTFSQPAAEASDTLPHQQTTSSIPAVSGEDLNLNDYNSATELEKLGLEVLKTALTCRAMKCGGTLQQRAERLYSVKGLQTQDIPPSLLARPPKK